VGFAISSDAARQTMATIPTDAAINDKTNNPRQPNTRIAGPAELRD
jgi:hypothetical protein